MHLGSVLTHERVEVGVEVLGVGDGLLGYLLLGSEDAAETLSFLSAAAVVGRYLDDYVGDG